MVTRVPALARATGVAAIFGAVLLAVLLGACAGRPFTPEPPPSEAQALEHLRAVIELVETGDVRTICDLGGPTCEMSLEGLDPRSVPRAPPTILGVRTLPAVSLGDGAWTGAGVIIELCGIDGLGKEYHSEMLVSWDRGRIVSTEPAYWLGIQIPTNPIVGAPTPPASPCPVS